MLERNTKIASSVIKIIQTQNKPITVKEIMAKLTEMSITAHRTTLFRLLKKLIQKNEISEIISKLGEKYYEIKSQDHDHFICNMCDKIICLDKKEISPTVKLKNLTKIKQFKIESHQLNVYGVCELCE